MDFRYKMAIVLISGIKLFRMHIWSLLILFNRNRIVIKQNYIAQDSRVNFQKNFEDLVIILRRWNVTEHLQAFWIEW